MSWAKSDDRYDDTPKIKRAWRLSGYAVGLHWMSVTSCARHESDGLVDPEWLAERLGVIPSKAARTAIETLVALGLYEPLAAGEQRTVFDRHGNAVRLGPVAEDTYIVHDYLDYQDSATTLEAKRADERLRKAIAAKAKESGLSISEYRKTPGFRVDFPPDSERKAPGIREASEDPDPTRPDPTRPDLGTPPLAPPADAGGEPGLPVQASLVRANSRALGTSGRHQDAAALEARQAAASTLAVDALADPTDEQRAGWERLQTALVQSVGGKATLEGNISELRLAAVEGAVLVIDGTEKAWGWARVRLVSALAQWSEHLGIEARIASSDEHDGFRAVAA